MRAEKGLTSSDLYRGFTKEPHHMHSTCSRCDSDRVAVWHMSNGTDWCAACVRYVMPKMAHKEQVERMYRLGAGNPTRKVLLDARA